MIGILSYLIFFAIVALIFAIATLGLNLQWGQAGLFNAGVVGFYAIGAYAFAILTAAPKPGLLGNFALPWIVGIIGAMLATAAISLVIGFATVRLRGDYLAIATFGIAVTIQLITLNFEALTGGSLGIASLARPLNGVFETPLGYNAAYLAIVIAITAGIYAALERIVRSPWGRVLKAIREDEIDRARQDRLTFPVANLRDRIDGDRPCGRALCELHWLRQPVRFPADPHLPDLDDADCRRQRQ